MVPKTYSVWYLSKSDSIKVGKRYKINKDTPMGVLIGNILRNLVSLDERMKKLEKIFKENRKLFKK